MALQYEGSKLWYHPLVVMVAPEIPRVHAYRGLHLFQGLPLAVSLISFHSKKHSKSTNLKPRQLTLQAVFTFTFKGILFCIWTVCQSRRWIIDIDLITSLVPNDSGVGDCCFNTINGSKTVLNSSIWQYYHFDLQINPLTCKERSGVRCEMIFKIFIQYLINVNNTHHTCKNKSF